MSKLEMLCCLNMHSEDRVVYYFNIVFNHENMLAAKAYKLRQYDVLAFANTDIVNNIEKIGILIVNFSIVIAFVLHYNNSIDV